MATQRLVLQKVSKSAVDSTHLKPDPKTGIPKMQSGNWEDFINGDMEIFLNINEVIIIHKRHICNQILYRFLFFKKNFIFTQNMGIFEI